MPTIEEGRVILVDTIVNKKTHKHYARVTELASLYRKLITGDGINTLLRQFVRREDEELFKQREILTQAITPAVSSSLMNPFYKVGRSNSIVKEIDFDSVESVDDKVKDISNAISKYNGEKSLDDYLEERYVDLNFTDPNSFIITEFDPVPLGPKGEMTAKVEPRPFEVSSTDAVNYLYKNNILQWVIVKLPVTYKAKDGKEAEGYSWTIYLDNDAIKYTQVDNEFVSLEINRSAQYQISTPTGVIVQTYFRASANELYLVEEFNYKSIINPARRVGYKKDLITNGETFVSPMHDALCYFMKSIKTVSEFDLTMALHAFPQKFQYTKRCVGTQVSPCDGGQNPEGGNCSICKGTGEVIHTTAQDAVTFRIPKDPADIFDLEKLVHYEHPPIELLKFQGEFIKQLKNEARQAVFNSEIFNKAMLADAATATEVRISLESVYDTLFPFAKAYSATYKYIVKVIAAFRDSPDVIVEHKFPKDFKFKTTAELLGDLKIASESNAPGYIKNQISLDISEQQFVDKPEEFRKILVKQKFFPFPDKNQTEIVFILSNNLTTERNRVLWSNFDAIFQDLEQDAEAEGEYFYDYAFVKQEELLDKALEELMLEINGESPAGAVDLKAAATEDGGGGVI